MTKKYDLYTAPFIFLLVLFLQSTLLFWPIPPLGFFLACSTPFGENIYYSLTLYVSSEEKRIILYKLLFISIFTMN